MPTPAAKDLQVLVDAAADNRRLRKQLEALREAELELAAREAEETAQTFSMLVGVLGLPSSTPLGDVIPLVIGCGNTAWQGNWCNALHC
jgi:hypothetical protein